MKYVGNKINTTLFTEPINCKELEETINEMLSSGAKSVNLYLNLTDYLFELREKKKVAPDIKFIKTFTKILIP